MEIMASDHTTKWQVKYIVLPQCVKQLVANHIIRNYTDTFYILHSNIFNLLIYHSSTTRYVCKIMNLLNQNFFELLNIL